MQSLVQSPDGRELQETAHDAVPASDLASQAMAETSRRWMNLLDCGALTPGLLSLLALSAGFGSTLVLAPAVQAEPTRLAANEANGPIVAFQQPTHADQLNGSAQISVSIRGRRYPAKWVELLVDDYAATKGGPVQLDASMLPVAHFNWDTRVYADGPHKLSVLVTDSQGFKGRSDVQVYINNKSGPDIIPPSVRWVNVRNGDVLRGNFPVQIEAKDNFGVKWVIVSLNPALSPAMKPALRGALLNIPPYIFQLNTSGLPASRYVLNAEAFDALNNRGAAPAIEVLIGPTSGNPTFNNVPNVPAPPKGIDIPSTNTGPSSGEAAAGVGVNNQNGANEGVSGTPAEAGNAPLIAKNPDNPAVGAQVAPKSTPSLNRGSSEAGSLVILPDAPNKNPLPQRAPVQTPSFAALPIVESRSVGPSVNLTRPQSSLASAFSKPVSPSETRLPSPEARVAKLNATQPDGVKRALARAGDVAAPSRNASTLPPLTAPVASTSSASRAARITQSSLPSAENRVALATQNTSQKAAPALANNATPQLSRSASTLLASNVARGESHAVKAPISVEKMASVPLSAPRALPKTASRPQVTHRSSLGTTGIARLFRDAKARPAFGPMVAILPAAVKPYPQIPSPNLSVATATGLRIKTPGAPRTAVKSPHSVPKVLPSIPMPSFALNKPMPQIGALRPLESITVAPIAQWGTKAEILPATHTVVRNESLTSIARRYKMPIAVLAAANNLKLTSGLQTGAKLNLPRALQVTYGGQPIKTDAASFMMGSVGVTPFRFLFEKQGGKLDWNAKTRKVTATGPQGNVELTIGSRNAVVNQKETLMDLAAFLMSGRTIVPVRFFEQALHAQVEWDPATGRLYVATTAPASAAPKG